MATAQAKEDAERDAKTKRDSSKREVIALARELKQLGMPSALALKHDGSGFFAPKLKVYAVGTSTGRSAPGNGAWGNQESTESASKIFISGDGDFYHQPNGVNGCVMGPMNLSALEKTPRVSAFDFEAAARTLGRIRDRFRRAS